MSPYRSPMFPLGTALLPSGLLPLHVFEPRYRAMLDEVLAGGREFGVVLIERGSETGGGDVRSSVATVAQVLDATPLDDGRWSVLTVGTRRLRIHEWLPDDPYPQAMVDDWPDLAGEPPVDDATVSRVRAALGQTLQLVQALGHQVDDAPDLADDPALAGYQIAVLAPLGPFDRQRILTAASVADRFALLEELLDEQQLLLRSQLDTD